MPRTKPEIRSTFRLTLPEPIGQVDLEVTPKGVLALYLSSAKHNTKPKKGALPCDCVESGGASEENLAAMRKVAEQACASLARYCETGRITQAPKLLMEGTEFQQAVWRELSRVKPGVTLSYGELAERVGRPGASRAVGGAMARNPLPIFVPCHRVLASTGKLGGFTGGLDTKARLLAHEGRSEFMDLFAHA